MTIRALLVGINYNGSVYELKGCIQDTRSTRDMLKNKFGVSDSSIVMMNDDLAQSSPEYPTPSNIMNNMRDVIKKSKPGDSIYFHYSGHGFTVDSGSMTAMGGKIDAGLHECVLARDKLKSNKNITAENTICGDAFNQLLELVPPDITLFGVIDTCNSGTVFDLSHNIRVKTEQACTESTCLKPDNSKLVYYLTHNKNRPCYRGNIILLSSTKMAGTAWDTTMNGKAMGALTGLWTAQINNDTAPKPYLDMLFIMHNKLKAKYQQDPQLSFCKLDLIGRSLLS
jgi:hypothetical protein